MSLGQAHMHQGYSRTSVEVKDELESLVNTF